MLADSSHFTGKYSRLNTPKLSIKMSRLRLARCIMMVGCGGWGAFAKTKLFRMTYLGSLALSSTSNGVNGIELDPSFFYLDMSEQIPVSYHIGMGIAKAFSEEHLSIPWLSHISSFKTRVSWVGAAVAGKVSLYAPPKGKVAKEPDLLGYDRNGKPHILESKGYSSGFKGAALQHAINQVSQVSSVSGVNPETRVAIFSDLSMSPFYARIVDPEGPDTGGCTIDWTLASCINDYYSVFLEHSENARIFSVNNQEYIGLDLIRPGFSIGIDTRIFDLLSNPQAEFESKVLRLLAGLQESRADSENYNIGIDGIALIDRFAISNR